MLRVPYSSQRTNYTCGPECLRIVLGSFGKQVSTRRLAPLAQTNPREGTSRKMMAKTLTALGLRVHAASGASLSDLQSWIDRGIPVIVNYREHNDISHYAVVVGLDKRHVYLHDPEHGPNLPIPRKEFLRRWYGKHHHVHTRWFLAAQPIANKKSL